MGGWNEVNFSSPLVQLGHSTDRLMASGARGAARSPGHCRASGPPGLRMRQPTHAADSEPERRAFYCSTQSARPVAQRTRDCGHERHCGAQWRTV